MGWYQGLTCSQRRILVSLAATVIVVVGLLVWSVWSTLGSRPALSPLPTPVLTPVSVLPTPTAQPSPTSTIEAVPSPSPTFEVSRAGFVAAAVAEARQARVRWGTPLTLVDDTGMAQAIYTHYQAHPPLMERAQPSLEALHLWFWDPLRLDVVSQAKGAAAFYAPELKELYLRRDWTSSLDVLDVHLAYGYARALPDQMGTIEAFLDDGASLDRWLAAAAVADGDALVSVWLYRGVEPGTAAARAIQDEIAEAICPHWRAEDPLLATVSCLPIRLGADFATSQYLAGGVPALDAAILRPPRSTEQLLDPERYATGDEPRALLPMAPKLGRDWVLTSTETLGAALMRVVLGELSDGAIADEAVSGWGGDLLQVWQTSEGETVAAWQTAWDDISAAMAFYGHLRDELPGGLVEGTARGVTPTVRLPGGRWWAGTRGVVFLYRRGDTVWLIWGDEPTAVETVVASVGQ